MRDATEIFSEWATAGRDEGMERGHARAVNEMLEAVIPNLCQPFSAIDLGCGNGWVVRKLVALGASEAAGVDGASEMVAKARSIDSVGAYHQARLPGWTPKEKVDLVHSMEFLYYLTDPAEMLREIHNVWLRQDGWLIAGVDHYAEHVESLEWGEQLNVHMTTMTMTEWREAFENAGFINVRIWQTATDDGSTGTLAMLGQRASDS